MVNEIENHLIKIVIKNFQEKTSIEIKKVSFEITVLEKVYSEIIQADVEMSNEDPTWFTQAIEVEIQDHQIAAVKKTIEMIIVIQKAWFLA